MQNSKSTSKFGYCLVEIENSVQIYSPNSCVNTAKLDWGGISKRIIEWWSGIEALVDDHLVPNEHTVFDFIFI